MRRSVAARAVSAWLGMILNIIAEYGMEYGMEPLKHWAEMSTIARLADILSPL